MTQTAVLLLDVDEAVLPGVRAALEAAGFQVHVGRGDPTSILEQPRVTLVFLGRPASGTLSQRVTLIRSVAPRPVSVVSLLRPEEPDILDAALNAGVDEFLFLPVRDDELVARARACVQRGEEFRE